MNPSPNNYTLGAGVLYFNKLNPATGLYEGERHLGNAPAVTSNVALEKLDHYSSTGGLKAKDKTVISQITPMLNFTLDEMSPENLALLYMADTAVISQAAEDDLSASLSSVNTGRYYELGDYKKIGITTLAYDGGTVIHTAGSTLTGGTSGTTATIAQVIGDATSGVLYLTDITGTGFEDDETLTDDGGTPGASVANGVVSFLSTAVSVEDTDSAGTFFTAGVDFTVDTNTGRILIATGGSIEDGDNLTVKYGCSEHTYTRLSGLSQTTIEGICRFVSDNPVGPNRELKVWRLSLTPSGDMAYIGDDWGSMGFEGEILKDAVNHPTNPYLQIDI